MKRLFQVGTEYFDNKMKAKDYRAMVGGRIEKGPDHIGNHGHRVPATRHRGERGINGRRATPARSKAGNFSTLH